MLYLAEGLTEDLGLDELDNPSMFEKFITSFDWNELIRKGILVLIRILFVLIVFFIIYKLGKWAIELFFKRYYKKNANISNRYQTIYWVSNNVFNAVFYFFLIYTILEILNFPVATLLASAGVVGLAVSLGAQGFVSDLVNGITIISEKQLDIGDEVTIDEITGTVLNLNLRTINVKDFDGTIHFIPNREITIVSNRSKGDMRARIEVRLFPDTDINRVREIVEAVNDKFIVDFPDITVPPNDILFVSNSNNQLIMRVVMYTKPGSQYGVQNKFYELYVSTLSKENIDLPHSVLETN